MENCDEAIPRGGEAPSYEMSGGFNYDHRDENCAAVRTAKLRSGRCGHWAPRIARTVRDAKKVGGALTCNDGWNWFESNQERRL
jgi:hypothetical protein